MIGSIFFKIIFFSFIFTYTNFSFANEVDIQFPFGNALYLLIIKFCLAAFVFSLLAIGLVGEPKNTPIKLGRWIGSILSSIAILSTVNYEHSQSEHFFRILIVSIGYYGIGFIFGYIWGKLKLFNFFNNFKTNLKSKDDSNLSAYAEALSELKSNRNDGLWAKCFAESYGDNAKAEAVYIRLRVEQLKAEAASVRLRLEQLKADAKTKDDIVEQDDEYNFKNAEYLFKNKLYSVKKYGQRTYLLLSNNNALIIFNNVVYVYKCESDFFRAIDIGNFKYRCGVSFKA